MKPQNIVYDIMSSILTPAEMKSVKINIKMDEDFNSSFLYVKPAMSLKQNNTTTTKGVSGSITLSLWGNMDLIEKITDKLMSIHPSFVFIENPKYMIILNDKIDYNLMLDITSFNMEVAITIKSGK